MGVCGQCHGVHLNARTRALWNRTTPARAYVLYASPTLDARPGQPNGATKLCLSCHDGAVAGNTHAARAEPPARGGLRRTGRIPSLTGGQVLAPPTPSLGLVPAIGPDLSDDHPVSFVYDAELALADEQLVVPEQAPSPLGRTVAADFLDERHEMQCTSCHNAHDDSNGEFLKVPNRGAALCNVCHERWGYDLSAHSGARVPPFRENCNVCHRQHGAAKLTPLLKRPERVLCGACHRRQASLMGPAAPTRHPIASQWVQAGVLTCSTCHDPHLVRPGRGLDRRIVTDPDDPTSQGKLIPSREVPFGYRVRPRLALEPRVSYCMDCHDGTWPGAVDVLAELNNPSAVRTNFRLGDRNLHATHTARPGSRRGVGCTYCHDAHGTRGNRGIRRGKLLYPWLIVNEFPYRSRRSCTTDDVLGACHSR